MDSQNHNLPVTSVSELDSSALINQRIGRATVYRMQIKLVTVADLLDLKRIKEARLYKGFVHADENGNRYSVTSWEEYCRLVEGRSREAIDLALANFEKLGLELFEALQGVGLGPRIMRDIRSLPEDDRQLIEQAAQAGSKEEIVDLLDALVTKHHKEKALLEEEVSNRDQKIENHEKHYQQLSDKHELVERDLHRLTRTKKPGEHAYNPRTFEVRHESAALEYGSRVYVDAIEVMYDAVLDEDASAQERELQLHAIGLAAGGILARAEKLYARVKDDLGDLMPIKPRGDYILTNEEKDRLDQSVNMIDINFTRKKNKRELEREEDKPTSAGRPKGSKNKKGSDDE
ncbi:MAG: hypothetical protein Q8N35_13215 [Methylococcaceae bacterium]|nr:hypothetical protein [Methylococcaceae bacterium]MDP2395038.1 hypothetical protein [Methylococcaceae bacterium]MDP3020538.1 hypothetical protein [Methylococcaceae bacterium]MDP3389729.1 hypothetical protein [Methylococcaceae bacterium]MDP3932526.1 hypothetical protein [Methylococcaceae bacterium]